MVFSFQNNIFGRFLNAICESSTEPQDSLTSIINDLEEIKKSKKAPKEEAEKVAVRINRIFSTFAPDQDHQAVRNAEQLYHLANLLFINDPATNEIWQHLSDAVHHFACQLFPYFTPSSIPADTTLNHPSPTQLQQGITQVIRFNDGHQFTLSFEKEENYALRFVMSESAEASLRVPSSPSKKVIAHIQTYLASLPPGICHFYDIKKLKGRIEELQNLQYLAAQITPMYQHRLFFLKQTYLNKQLEALGIPIICPINVGKEGEWILESRAERKSLQEYFSETTDLKPFAEQLAHFLLLERMLGIYILGDSETNLSSSASCLLEMHGEAVQCAAPKQRIEWIKKSKEERLQEILQHLQSLFPEQEKCFEQVRRLVENAPDTFKDIDDLHRYFAIHKAISKFKHKKSGSFKTLYHWCKRLILNLPAKGRPNPLQNGSDFTLVYEQDKIVRADIKYYAFLELLYRMKKRPDTSFKDHCETIIEEINAELNLDQDLASEDCAGCKKIGDYFTAIFWQHFFEEYEDIFSLSDQSSTFIHKLIAIKNSSENAETKQKELEKLLFRALQSSEAQKTSHFAINCLNS